MADSLLQVKELLEKQIKVTKHVGRIQHKKIKMILPDEENRLCKSRNRCQDVKEIKIPIDNNQNRIGILEIVI